MAVVGYGTGGYALGEPWGSVLFAAPPSPRSLGPFGFECLAKSEGFSILVSFTAPEPADAPEWLRQVRILRKVGEWPQSFDDPGASVVLDDIFPAAGTFSVLQEELVQGQIYYYALFAKRTDGAWVHDRFLDRCSSYPYDRWGACDYMFASLPRGFRSQDVGFDHLYGFICIFGTLVDDLKTDVEHLKTLFEIDNIHDDLIFLLDRTIGWPTWHATGGLQRRRETADAVSVYKIKGREAAYAQVLGEISNWELVLVEGWRYVMFSNGKYGSTTPDFTDPDLLRYVGRIADVLKYTNDGEGWHAVQGLGFFMYEIPGVSGPFAGDMLRRTQEMIEFTKASYVTTKLTMVPIVEEEFPLFRVLDSFGDVTTLTELMPLTLEEDLGYTTDELSLFLSLDPGSVTNNLADRVFHEDLEYV